MALYVKSPTVYSSKLPDDITVFLAGGITGCPNWQAEIENKLGNSPYVLFNPRRDGQFNTLQPEWGVQQIEWEHHHLEKADYVLFWFPKEGQCMITLFELGKCLALNKPVVIGCDPGYIREFDVRTQARLMRPNIPVATSLDELVMNLNVLIATTETKDIKVDK